MCTCFIVSTFSLYFENWLEVKYFMNNDVDTLLSRIYFVQRNEPRSKYVYKIVYFSKLFFLCLVAYIYGARYFPLGSFPHWFFPLGLFPASLFPARSFPRWVFSLPVFSPLVLFHTGIFSAKKSTDGEKLSKKFL